MVTVARERCGGQGYLSCNKFGHYLGLAHAACTAEGDNSVLMQKVAKEHLSAYNFSSPPPKPENIDLISFNHLLFFLRMREFVAFGKLGQAMKAAGKNKSALFNTWMYNASDLVQHAAMSYAELLMAESLLETFNACPNHAKWALDEISKMFLTDTINRDMNFFLLNSLMTTEEASVVKAAKQNSIAELSKYTLSLTEAFGLPEELLKTPISGNWVTYNDHDNQGEIDF